MLERGITTPHKHHSMLLRPLGFHSCACLLRFGHVRALVTSACAANAPGPAWQEPHYAALRLDRAAQLRADEAAMERLRAHPAAKVAPVCQGKSLVTAGEQPGSVLLPLAQLRPHVMEGTLVFLGLEQEVPVWGAACPAGDADQVAAIAGDGSGQVRWVDLRREGPKLEGGAAALLALAQGLVHWNLANAYDGCSGATTSNVQGGHARVAAGPGARMIYPRIDPAVIMLVHCGPYALLGRQPRWTPGRYSCLAGFAELGETLEMAVAREVAEEAGVKLDPGSIAYRASQPWPFPQSLMIGFEAAAAAGDGASEAGNRAIQEVQATGQQLTEEEVAATVLAELRLPAPAVDRTEIEDARWFHAAWLERQLSHAGASSSTGQTEPAQPGCGAFSVPGSYALAHRIIAGWLGGRRRQQPGGSWREDVAEVEVDENGTYKYMLLRLRCPSGDPGRSRLLVRGSGRAGYHREVLARARELDVHDGSQVVPLGGGRIAMDAHAKTAHVYGYSSEFDQAPHSVTAALLRRWCPFHSVTVSYSGY